MSTWRVSRPSSCRANRKAGSLAGLSVVRERGRPAAEQNGRRTRAGVESPVRRSQPAQPLKDAGLVSAGGPAGCAWGTSR
jgi:hypothetical protein